MSLPFPLSALLSQVLVAFTIEFDNEFEHRMPHQTTRYGKTKDAPYTPWLVSLVMWSNCMRFVDEKGITVGELRQRARVETNIDGMRRWGYVRIEPGTSEVKKIQSDMVLRATPAGQRAREIWQPLFGEIEARWHERFGREEIERLRDTLGELVNQFEVELPDCLPILSHGLYSRDRHAGGERFVAPKAGHVTELQGEQDSRNDAGRSLYVLLAQALLAFAIAFEQVADLSLPICADVLRVLDERGVQMRELPKLGGVSKEAISMAIGILQERRMVMVEPDQERGRFNIVRLSDRGLQAQHRSRQLLEMIEERWRERFGEEAIYTLRESLEPLVGMPTAQQSPLFRGLVPYADGWRARVRPPELLPHFPMVLHRGGFPDGS
jgi:DNA-binding MarR family transcriptional regulator